jgi:hypothetical protein
LKMVMALSKCQKRSIAMLRDNTTVLPNYFP